MLYLPIVRVGVGRHRVVKPLGTFDYSEQYFQCSTQKTSAGHIQEISSVDCQNLSMSAENGLSGHGTTTWRAVSLHDKQKVVLKTLWRS
ncbi:hypothetical protein K503DRAFT_869003 [Rhizopogon vinicolor AM-OR11-026]|uniref:Uncharacterized protein n=1 Tax=Rhizopogon vinicolor AM-OR11-026 TaxID=1314800 RepID=A0A1B7MNW4_9AGAM|nr:hypothetical protein K503DRAFT_869003 [Rhizopogon vinicolor AM-OR11-026]